MSVFLSCCRRNLREHRRKTEILVVRIRTPYWLFRARTIVSRKIGVSRGESNRQCKSVCFSPRAFPRDCLSLFATPVEFYLPILLKNVEEDGTNFKFQ